MPVTAEILNFFQRYYDIWGYQMIFFGALLENILPLGYFVPGSTVIWLGAFYSYQGKLSITHVIIIGTLGAFLGHNVDYLMGRKGWYLIFKRFVSEKNLERAKSYILNQKYLEALVIYFIGYTRSLLIIGMGVTRVSYLRFASSAIISALLWNIFFGIFGYKVGGKRYFVERGLNIFWLVGFFLLFSYFLGKVISNRRNRKQDL